MFVYWFIFLAPKNKSLSRRVGLLLRGAFPFPCVHFVWCWSTHSSTIFLLGGTLLFSLARAQAISPVLPSLLVFFCCVCGEFLSTSPNSGAKIVGGFQRLIKTFFCILFFVFCVIFLFFLLFYYE